VVIYGRSTMNGVASSPFRLGPPELPAGLVSRPRLLDELRSRFDRRLTVVVAGAGFGKTTLMTHALAENQLDPNGRDVWLMLTDRDRRPGHLLAGLAAALGADPGGVDVDVAQIVELAWGAAPEDVALVLDDAHVLDGSPAWDTVADLCEHLPENAHLVMSSRTTPPLPMRLLQARGRAVVLDEASLAFTPDELAQFANVRQVEIREGDVLPSWPALAVLMSTVGREASLQFLWESVLRAVPEDRRRALASMVRFGRIDDALVSAVVGDGWSAARLVDGLPLIESSGSVHRFHDLWRDALLDHLPPAEWRVALTVGAELLAERGELVRAAVCLAEAGATEGVVRLARRFASSSISTGLSGVEADVFLDLIPLGERQGPLGSYLVALRSGSFDTIGVQRDMERIHRVALEAGDDEMASLAMWRITQLTGDADPAQLTVGPELQRLADAGWPTARSAVALVASHQAERRHDVAAALAAVAGFESTDPISLRASVTSRHLALGHPERVAITLHEVLAEGVTDPVSAQTVWFRGEIDPVVAWPIAAGLPALHGQRRLPNVQVPLLSIVSTVALMAGNVADARRLADSALQLGQPLLPRVALFARVADALVILATDGEPAAAARFQQMVADVPVEPWPAWAYLGALSSVRALVPGTEWLDELEMGPAMRTAIAAGRSIVELRAGDPDGAFRLPWDQTDLMRVHVPPPLLCELAVAVERDVPLAAACLRALPDVERWLARLVDHPYLPVRTSARAATSTTPTRPPYDVHLTTFGEFAIRRSDGAESADRARGGRVQQLLARLVIEAAPSRTDLAARLWPALDAKQAGTNLRVTLASLLDMIEPDRHAGASWFVRSVDGRLQLVDDGVLVDARAFDADLDAARAAERAGTPSVALERYRSAVDRYGGEFFPGVDDVDVEQERLRLQTMAYHAACRVAELMLAKGEPEASLRAAAAATRIDPISERARRLEIRSHLALGSTSAARAVARALRATLVAEQLTPERDTELLLGKLDA
jgi:LuxR family maltose regulon positive regulatory protein